MMKLSLKHDIGKLTKTLSDIQKKQIPFAASQAINDTLFNIQRETKKQMPRKLDRPTRYTLGAFRVNKASKRKLKGQVYLHDSRRYLEWQIEGGTRRNGAKKIGVPFNATLNQYGNIPARKRGLIKNKNQFIATIKGITGVWERGNYDRKGKFRSNGKSKATAVKLMVAFEVDVQYKKRFPFYKIAEGVARNQFPRYFKRRLERALETARYS